ncbi:MAG: DUF3784 domain-containing protein [Tidjanibacter sp.]|nr:DUF3784 domain-containing protein [Tidjanibacter sp.]
MEIAEIITLWWLAALFALFGILILIGKGDWLISGYNTASAEKRAQYNIRRLRLVMGITCLAMGVVMLLAPIVKYEMFILVTTLPIVIPALILSNTWAKN